TTAAGGSDLQDIHLRDLRTGHDLAEVVPRVKFTGVSWTRDGKGFYYSRFRGSVERANLQAANTHHQLFYHVLGGGVERLVFERPDDSTAGVGGGVCDSGRRLVVASVVGVRPRGRVFDRAGRARGEVALPDVGTAAGLTGRNDGSDVFFAFSSYLRPATVYRYDLRAGRLEPFQPARTPFDPAPYETRATFYQSKDGTHVPIFITARKGLARDGSHPTLLYGYGGVELSLPPFYSPP